MKLSWPVGVFVVEVVVELEVEVFGGLVTRMQIPMMELDGLIKEKDKKKYEISPQIIEEEKTKIILSNIYVFF